MKRIRLKHHELAHRLAESRISQNSWARRLGISKAYLSQLVNERRRYPSGETRCRLLSALDLEFEDLFLVESESGPEPEREGLLPAWRAAHVDPVMTLRTS